MILTDSKNSFRVLFRTLVLLHLYHCISFVSCDALQIKKNLNVNLDDNRVETSESDEYFSTNDLLTKAEEEAVNLDDDVIFSHVNDIGKENEADSLISISNISNSLRDQKSSVEKEIPTGKKLQNDNMSLRDILLSLKHPQFKENTPGEDFYSNKKTDRKVEIGDEHIALNHDGKNSLQLNSSETDILNISDNNSTLSNNTNNKKSFCIDVARETIGDVEILNATELQSLLSHNPNITGRSVPTKCYLVYFFSSYCPFSTQGSAYVNALARSLKNIPVYGLDSIMYHSMNARYGVMGTPSLILFHNGNTVARYNASEYSTFNLESFIHHYTNQIIDSINVTSHDFKAALPCAILSSPPYALYAAWVFLITCSVWLFFNSEIYAKLTEAVLNNWREAEAQHAHDD